MKISLSPCLLFFLLLISANVAEAGQRLALVIGNAEYSSIVTLDTSTHDAYTLANMLKTPQAGFDVTHLVNLDGKALKTAMRRFKASIHRGDTVVVYYAGHAVEIKGSNYLLPIDLALTERDDVATKEEQIKDESLSLQRILDDLNERQPDAALIIMDACRDNPLPNIGKKRGLAPTKAYSGQMIVYAAGTNERAIDHIEAATTSTNGLLMQVLKKHLSEEIAQQNGIPVKLMIDSVTTEVTRVAKAYGESQNPGVYVQSMPDFYLIKQTTNPVPHNDGTGAINKNVEIAFWKTVVERNSIEMVDAYRKKYPKGAFIALAQSMREKLLKKPETACQKMLAQDQYSLTLAACKQEAEQGDVFAQTMMGQLYLSDKGGEKDDAVVWLEKAVKQGDALAQYLLGGMYLDGRLSNFLGGNMATGVELVRQAANQGLAQAQAKMGNLYYTGWKKRWHNIAPDPVASVVWYLKAAEQGSWSAELMLAYMTYTGKGVKKDQAFATQWLKKAVLHYDGSKTFDRISRGSFYEERGDWSFYEKLRDAVIGKAEAQETLAYKFDGGYPPVKADYATALYWYKKAAEQGRTSSQLRVAYAYDEGKGIKKDDAQAVHWYQKAAEPGDWTFSARNNLGIKYFNGSGVQQDRAKAFELFSFPAELGNSYAQYMLGFIYEHGYEPVDRDYTQAAQWYEKSAKQGYDVGQYNLGRMYEAGKGVEKSMKQAAYWYEKAVKQGHKKAKKAALRLMKQQ